jgi:uncharacterized protein YjdB
MNFYTTYCKLLVLCSIIAFYTPAVEALTPVPDGFWAQPGTNNSAANWGVSDANELIYNSAVSGTGVVATQLGFTPPYTQTTISFKLYVPSSGAKSSIVLGSNSGNLGVGEYFTINNNLLNVTRGLSSAPTLLSDDTYSGIITQNDFNQFDFNVNATGLVTITVNGNVLINKYQTEVSLLNNNFIFFASNYPTFKLKNLSATKNSVEKKWFYASPINYISGNCYVDAINGSDSNAGNSELNAWKSFDRINTSILQPGTKILLKKGCTWNKRLEIRGAGTKDNWIKVTSYGTGNIKPKISLTNDSNDIALLITDLDKTTGTARAQKMDYIEVDGLEIANSRLGIYYRSIMRTENTGFKVRNMTFTNITCDAMMRRVNFGTNRDAKHAVINQIMQTPKGNLESITGNTGGINEYIFPAAIFVGGQTLTPQKVNGIHTTILTEFEVDNCTFNEIIAGIQSIFYFPFSEGKGEELWRQLIHKIRITNCWGAGNVNGIIAFDGVNGGAVLGPDGVMQPDAEGWGLVKNINISLGRINPDGAWPDGTTGVIFCNSQKFLVDSCDFSEILNYNQPDGCGFDFEANDYQITLQNSKFFNNDAYAILLMNGGGYGGHKDLIIQNNLCVGNMKNTDKNVHLDFTSNRDGHQNITVKNNTFFMRKKNKNGVDNILIDPISTFASVYNNDLYYLDDTAPEVSVNFQSKTYTYKAIPVSRKIAITNSDLGVITVKDDANNIILNATKVQDNKTLTFTATPVSGYELDYFVVNTKRIPSNTYTVTSTDFEVSASYLKADGPVNSIILNKSVSYNILGTADTIICKVRPTLTANKTVRWTSSNTNVATVDPQGIIATKTLGTATITAITIDGGKKATCVLNVVSAPVFPLTDFMPQYEQNANWSVNSKNILSFVGTPASVTGAAVATTFATIQAPYKAIKIIFDAFIADDGKSVLLTLGSTNKTLNSGTTILINKWQVQGLTNMDYSKAVMLSSASTIYQFDVIKPNSLNSIQIDVSENGSIVVSVNGYTCPTTYQADLSSLSGQYALITTEFSPFQLKNLQVTKAANTREWFYDFKSVPVNLVSFSNSPISLSERDNIQLVPEIMPANATNKNVKWFSNNDQVAIVNENGIVTGIKLGNTNITAVSDNGNIAGTCQVNVTANGQPSAPQVLELSVNNGDYFSADRTVSVVSYAKGLPTEYCISSNETFSTSSWKTYKSKDTYELLNVSGKQTVYFKLKNSLGESSVKAVELVYKPAPTKLDATNRTHPARITVSPNPVQGLARIKIESDVNLNGNVALADKEQYKLTITTLSGIQMQDIKTFGNEFILDLSALKTGTYLLKVHGESIAFTRLIFKK